MKKIDITVSWSIDMFGAAMVRVLAEDGKESLIVSSYAHESGCHESTYDIEGSDIEEIVNSILALGLENENDSNGILESQSPNDEDEDEEDYGTGVEWSLSIDIDDDSILYCHADDTLANQEILSIIESAVSDCIDVEHLYFPCW